MTYDIKKATPEEWKKVKYGGFPFLKLKVGEYFLESKLANVPRLRVWAIHYAKDTDGKVKFSIRKSTDGYRCYRIK